MSSDSSDEENLEFLREAQDNQLINDSMFSEDCEKSLNKTSDNQKPESLPSQRIVDDGEAQFNFLRVTPEFRNHIAKKLSQILDSKLNKSLTDVEVDESPRKKRVKGGVKLLSDSKHFLKLPKATDNTGSEAVESVNSRKVPRYKKYKIEVTAESLREVAVSPEDILSQKEVKAWSKRSKAPLYKYKKSPHGQLELVEP